MENKYYTRKQILLLVDMIGHWYDLKYIKEYFNKKYIRKRYYYKDIKEHFISDALKYMFNVKYTDLPLHINEPEKEHIIPNKYRLAIINWRLKVGK